MSSPMETLRTLHRLSVIAGVTGVVAGVASTFFAAGKTPEWGYEHLSLHWSGGILRGCGIRAEVRGLHHVNPGTPCMYVSNHGSEWDWYLFTQFVRLDWRAVIRADLRNFPLGGTMSAKTGQLFLPPRASTTDLIDMCRPVFARGTSILMYPEGKRPTDGKLGDFRRGAFEAAAACHVPVVPVAVVEQYPASRPGPFGRGYGHNPGKVKLTVLPPLLPTSTDYASVTKLLEDARNSILNEIRTV